MTNLKTRTIGKAMAAGIAIVCCMPLAYGQAVYDYKKSADQFYAKGDYYSAAIYYEKYLEQKGKPAKSASYEPYLVQGSGKKVSSKKDKSADTRDEIVYRIAESYRKLNDYAKAEKWYEELAKANNPAYPLAGYWYGVSLRANEKYDEAAEQLKTFAASYKQSDEYSKQAAIEIANCNFIQGQLKRKDADLYKTEKLAVNVQQGSNYAPVLDNNNNLLFTSSRADSSVLTAKNKNPHVNNLYQSANQAAATKLAIAAPVAGEQGAASLSADGNTLYFTRWTQNGAVKSSSIYVSKKENNNWSEPVQLNANINAEGSNARQPYITTDGKYLFFASDRAGGYGKFDIWLAPVDASGNAGTAVNLGNTINTTEDDQAPYYHQAIQQLIYASKGFTGMGGFDLFSSKGVAGGSWSAPVNLGYPVNSVKDDIYFTSNSKQLLENAIISTDRGSDCCLELLAIHKTYKKYITGVVKDCGTGAILDNVAIRASNDKGATLVTQQTGTDGSYLFETTAFVPLQIAASKAQYRDTLVSFAVPVADVDTLYNAAICLAAIPPPPPVVDTPANPEEQKAYFDFAKYDLKPETVVLLDTLANILKRERSLGLEIVGYTDKYGTPEYNQKLSEERANACMNYLIQQGVEARKLKATGKGECCPVQPETNSDGSDNPTARQANRRVEFKIIFIR